MFFLILFCFFYLKFCVSRNILFFSIPIVKILNLLGISLVEESENYDFDEKHLKTSKGIRFFYGGWHSEKYFCSNREQVLETFKLKVEDAVNLNYLEEIKNTESVAIHVRRGDYMKGVHFEMFGSVCTKEYFEEAINKLNKEVENPHFFVFSNDLKWVQENFKMDKCTLVDCNKAKDSWKDMYLISNCKHNINSNSTFSWWGAWFNKNENKIVIVPKYFINNLDTKDFYPEKWIKITDY